MASFKLLGKDNWQVRFYCQDFKGVNKQYKKRGFKTKKEALIYANNYINLHSGNSDIKIGVLANEYLKNKSKFLKLNTIKSYKFTNKYILKYLDDVSIKDLTPLMCYKFLMNFTDTPRMLQRIRLLLNGILEYAILYYGLNVNPLSKVKIDIKYTKKQQEIYTIEEFQKFDNILKDNCQLKTRAFFNLLYYSGARVGEITALKINDIDFNNNTININKTRITKTITNTPKNDASYRTIAIPQKTMKLLKGYIDELPPLYLKTFLFSSSNIYKTLLTNLIKKHNLKKINLHGFRHSHTSLLINKGVDIATISNRLGHANSQITLSTYAHFYKNKDNKKLINLLNDI